MKKVILIAVAFVAVIVPAKAGDPFVGVDVGSFLYKERTKEVRSGLTPLVTFSEKGDKAVQTGSWTGGDLCFPGNKSGLFPELAFFHVDLLVLGVKDKDLRERRVDSDDPAVGFDHNSNIVIDTAELSYGRHYMVIDQDQKASRRDRRILFFLRTGDNLLRTDQVALTFMVLDPVEHVEEFCASKLTGATLKNAPEELIYAATTAYLEKAVGNVKLVKTRLSAQEQIEKLWRQSQGIPLPLDPPVKDTPIVETRTVSTPQTKGLVHFTINVVSSDGQAFFVPGMRIRIGEKAFNFLSSSCEIERQPGTYKARFFIPGRGDSGWFEMKVEPGKKPVTITVTEGVTQ